MATTRLIWVAGLVVLAGVLAPPAHAAFPGQNGKLAYDAGCNGPETCLEIFVVNHDGTGLVQLTSNSVADKYPAWSPDGTKIAFVSDRTGAREIFTMNADGSNPVRITRGGRAPAWSPDGTKLVFSRTICPPPPAFCDGSGSQAYDELRVVNADGSGETEILQSAAILDPRWAPDGSRIAFGYTTSHTQAPSVATIEPDGSDFGYLTPIDCFESAPDWSPNTARLVFTSDTLTTINADGSGRSPPCGGPGLLGDSPVWSPDGTKIAYVRFQSSGYQLRMANPDFTGDQLVLPITPPGQTWVPGLDWQPIPINAYPRPKGATPLYASLVPAYAACGSPNREHGPPLAFASCNPPTQASDELTVGSADSNGKPTRSTSSIRLKTLPGIPSTPADEADVELRADVDDVYNQITLDDYTGELRAQTSLRITDKLNTPHPGGPGAGTVTDFPFGFTIPCATTPDPDAGSDCALTTTAEALYPGALVEGRRAIWELGAVEVYDGGADDDADTPGDNTLFMKQGIFVP